MEHIGNYLDKYRKMIAEHDAQEELSEAVDNLQTALIEQGKAIEDCKKACQEALAGLEKLYESSK